jgi:hypothetical protein
MMVAGRGVSATPAKAVGQALDLEPRDEVVEP